MTAPAAAPPHIVIIGAGYAGMAAAVTLADSGARVTVYESAPTAGGRARRIRTSGREFDNGQHLLVGAYRELLGLMARIGVSDAALLRMPFEIRYPHAQRAPGACASGAVPAFRLRALALPRPLDLLGGMLTAHGMTVAERWRAMRFIAAMRSRGFVLERDCTVAELLDAHAQHGPMSSYVWDPLCVAALNTPSQSASAAVFLRVLRDTLDGPPGSSDFLIPRVDLSRLFPEPAIEYVRARGAQVHLRTPVRDITAAAGRWSVHDGTFDALIVATGVHHLATIARSLPALDARAARAVQLGYQPIHTCYLKYPDHVRLPAPMLGMSGGLIQWVFDRGMACGESGLIACVISAEGRHCDMTHAALADTCHAELDMALGPYPQPQWAQVVAEKRATLACGVGYSALVHEALPPGVFLAGDYVYNEYPPTLEAAVRSGIRAAHAALAHVAA